MMDAPFPIGFDNDLILYLVIYVATWIIHFFLMAYVLGGSLYLAGLAVLPARSAKIDDIALNEKASTNKTIAGLLRDWMPFALSGAITAGVAPLLFVQILYRQEFYTANLLLGWRWMVVIPVLIAAFYLLYVVKSRRVSEWSLAMRAGLALAVAACFVFVAFCWTANHLLGLERDRWPDVYQSGHVIGSLSLLVPRLVTWIALTFPALSLIVGWQLRYHSRLKQNSLPAELANREVMTLARLSIVGMVVATGSAVVYFFQLDSGLRANLVSAHGFIWLIATVAGIVLQAIVWLMPGNRLTIVRLSIITAGGLLMMTGVAVMREIIRLGQLDLAKVTSDVLRAGEVGGFFTFLVFAAVNAFLIGYCVWLVTRYAGGAGRKED